MSMITSSPPTKGGVHPGSVADFQFAFQALSQQPFPSIPKNIASISIPQPLTRLSPQPPSSLYLPATVTTPDVGKKQRSLKGGNRSRNSTNDKVKKRLARKAELARASRRRKKAYIQDLEDKVNRLTQQVLTLQRERALLGLPSTLASSTFTPISSSPRSNKNSINSDDSDSGDNEKEKNSTYETSELEPNTGSSTSSTNENNLMVDGLSGLASAASRLANMEDLLELGGSKTSTETKNSSSPVKTESEDGESDLDKCEEEIKPKNKKVASPSISGRTAGSGNFTVDPNLPLSLFALSQPTSQSTPTVPVPLPSRSLTTSSSTTSLSSHSPPMSSSFLSTSRVSAFTTTRQGKQESGNNERCIKASYNGDTRRFSLTEKNFSYSSLVQTLRETYQNLPSSFTIKYRDEEQDYINITTTAEFREAYRLLCLTPLSPSSPTSQTPSSTPPQKILKLIIESNQSSPLSTTTKLKGKNGTSSNSSSLNRKKNQKNGSSHTRGNKRKTSISPSCSESPTTLSLCSNSTPPSPLKKQRHREIPLPPKFPSTSFPIFLQGVDTNIDEHSTIPPFCLIVDSSMTIEQLKNDIAKMQPSLSAGVYYQYSYHGQILDDNNKYIKDYGITKGSVIRLDRLESITPPRFYPSFMLPPSSTPTSTTSSTSTMETDNNPLSNPLSFFFPQILPLLSTAAATSAFSESTPAITSGFSFPQLDLSSTTITTPMSSEYDTKQPRSTEYDTKLPRSTEYDTKQPRSTEYDAKQPRSMEYDMKRNKNNLSINGINLTNQPQADSTTCATLISSIKYPLMGSTPSLPVLLGA